MKKISQKNKDMHFQIKWPTELFLDKMRMMQIRKTHTVTFQQAYGERKGHRIGLSG